MSRPSRKAVLPVLALLLAALLGQGCMTLLGRRSQSVTVTASSVGAGVYVDGKFAGVTPLALTVTKRAPGVIRIEKDGYRPVEIRLKKRKAWILIVLPNLLWAGLGSPALTAVDIQTDRDRLFAGFFVALGLAAPVAAMIIDGLSDKSTMLAPRHLDIRLEADTGTGAGPLVLVMDAVSFRGVRWISVRDGDK